MICLGVQNAPYEYTWEEWSSHIKIHWGSMEDETSRELLPHWFRLRYPDPEEALWKANRLLVAMEWMSYLLDSYPDDFEVFNKVEKDFVVTSGHVVSAFWRLYAAMPETELREFVPSVELVKKFALESLKFSSAN